MLAPNLNPSKRSRGGLSTEIFQKISDEIVLGQLAPGEHLDEATLAQRFSVSRTPVREALKQLSSSGLVVVRPNRGCTVVQRSTEDLDQIFEAIGELEATCARHAVVRMKEDEKNRLLELHAKSRLSVQAADAFAYDKFNKDFHHLIIEGSHNPYLIESVMGLRQKISMYRRTQFLNIERMTASFEEHSLIVEAILSRDVVHCYREVRNHLFQARAASKNLPPVWSPT